MLKPAIVQRDHTRALDVLGVEVRFLCPGDMTGRAFSLMELVIPTGEGPPPHHHDWAEAYYVVSGAVEFHIEGEHSVVGAGDFAFTPAGAVHGFRGASDEPARMLVFDAPAHAEHFFREFDREVGKSPQDFAKAPEIGARHGIHFLPPKAA